METGFFGNISTRCQHLFPSTRLSDRKEQDNPHILVSPRNTDKTGTYKLIEAYYYDNNIIYEEEHKKPSVDTPCQLNIYEEFPYINYMIHGHAFIKNAPITGKYCFCGDILESNYISPIIRKNTNKFGTMNLKNHGFLMYADTLENLEKIIKESNFTFDKFEI